MKRRVLLGMSGGVDSSVVAMLLLREKYEVIGITFLFSNLDDQNVQVVKEADLLAKKLEIEHYVADLREEFSEHIIRYFTKEYSSGNTPFPCAKCNPDVKFKNLVLYAKEYNCDFISTGHYAKILDYNNNKYVSKGSDAEKDQSFFLWGLNSEVLNKLVLPLGTVNKSDTRKYANSLGFKQLSEKKDSLGICFIEGNNYREFLELNGVKSEPGNFVNKKGEILGEHKGIFNYTVGQRRGLGLNFNKPLFVYDIDTEKCEVVLSEYDDLYKHKLVVKGVKFVDINEIEKNRVFVLKIRYRLQNTPCRIELLDGDEALVHLLEPLAMVARGQTAVFYHGDRVVGRGFIKHSE